MQMVYTAPLVKIRPVHLWVGIG